MNAATKCDGTIDAPFAGVWSSNPKNNNLCMYWDAAKPPQTAKADAWGGNIQVRYGTGVGGDKTINFNDLLGPNAVNISQLKAVGEASKASLAAWAAAMMLAASALFLWRRKA